ncbi:MAG: hydrogenase 3 maturation endopeptidase HyCI [Methanoregula sp.]
MKSAPCSDDTDLRHRLAGARRVAVVGIGDEDSPVDRLGMVAARELARSAIPGVRVFFAGTVPESMTGPLREFHPDHVLFLDAADMGNPPGTVAVIDPERISAGQVSTHALPLSVVMEFIAEDTGAKVTLVGIQPEMGPGGMSGECEEILYRNIGELEGILRNVCG